MLNKEIFDAKLAITSDCILSCKYCFVRKDRSYMDFDTAKKAVDMVLSSPGKEKIIRIYGGEPLLHFKLIEEIVPYIYKKAKQENKQPTLTLCTNSILLTIYRIKFLKKYRFKFAISLDGKRIYHDKYRVYAGNASSFNSLSKNIPLVLQQMHRKDLAAGLSVLPDTSSKLFENFKYVIHLGFDAVNIEPTYGFGVWTKEKRICFFNNMAKIVEHIFSGINSGKFIFLTTINRELRYGTLSKMRNGVCHFWNSLEFCPKGEMGFSSFLLNKPGNSRYVIGNINKGVYPRYRDCSFSLANSKCEKCKRGYFVGHDDCSNSSEIVGIRDIISIKSSREIARRARSSGNFRRYIIEAKKHICF